MRGEESRGDALFVRELAGRLGLPVCIREVQVAAAPDNLEQAARVALGHTRSDQAEILDGLIAEGAARKRERTG